LHEPDELQKGVPWVDWLSFDMGLKDEYGAILKAKWNKDQLVRFHLVPVRRMGTR